ncbi:carbonate dehydratase [uncultured Pseudoteredinibacter sp.]|uniref:carbonate dehydratase n=1 Tax=uncultured Pseudoteredinibacter sp. TaxID=1641701 RepID=UPI002607EA2F|nr:carbonate dehydratase [uncultured Pseudoteredinibacter sp.]
MKKLSYLFEANKKWSESIKDKDPEFFSRLSKQQAPDYLWIGCSDSRVPANTLVDLPPGEVFVHRNIANVVVHTDLNMLSVLHYAVAVLKVKHVIICGHYGCGGVMAAMEDKSHGLIDNWLRHIKDVARFHKDELDKLSEAERIDRMCELNVMEQVRNVANTSVVKNAWSEGQVLSVHGWIYNINNGVLNDLDMCVSDSSELSPES